MTVVAVTVAAVTVAAAIVGVIAGVIVGVVVVVARGSSGHSGDRVWGRVIRRRGGSKISNNETTLTFTSVRELTRPARNLEFEDLSSLLPYFHRSESEVSEMDHFTHPSTLPQK